MKQEKKQLFPLNFFFFTASLAVCTITFPAMGTCAVFLSLIMVLFSNNLLKIQNISLYFSFVFKLYFFPMLVAALIACIMLSFRNDVFYYEYFKSFLPSRLIHLFAFICFFIYAHNLLSSSSIKYLNRSLYIYALGVFLILGVFGIWQIFHNVLGIWVPTVETRNELYFASFMGLQRVTSLADEPSYLVPFLIDAMLICFYLKRKILSCLFLVVCLFSLSFGGYLELIILCITYVFLTKSFSKLKFLLWGGAIVFCLVIIFPDAVEMTLEIIGSRKELSSDFEVTDTARTTMIVYPWKILFQGNLLSILFGNGPSSFKYLHLKIKQPNGDEFHTTSNNLYTDIAYEGGVLSILCLIILFIYMWKMFSNIKVLHFQRETFFAKLFLVHIATSSFYRGDYISARFISLFLIIEIFYLIILQKDDFSNNSNLSSTTIY